MNPIAIFQGEFSGRPAAVMVDARRGRAFGPLFYGVGWARDPGLEIAHFIGWIAMYGVRDVTTLTPDQLKDAHKRWLQEEDRRERLDQDTMADTEPVPPC